MHLLRCTALLAVLVPAVYAQTPVIEILPGTSVIVGEEVFFNGSGSSVGNPASATYEWTFGDGRSGILEGSAVTHCYMRPGTFTVTLTITGLGSATSSVTVTGGYTDLPPLGVSPALELMFEDDLTDGSGNGTDGTWQNGTGSYIDGVEYRSVNMTGGAYVTVPSFTAVNGAAGFTVSLWAQKGANDASGTIIALPGVFRIRTTSSGDALNGYITTATGSNSSQTWYFGGNDLSWHHYSLVYDGSHIRLYADGQEQFFSDRCPRALTGAAATATGALHIGCNDGGSDGFNGNIDNVKIYDRVLSPKELSTGFELWHADFNGRIRAYVYTQIPTAVTADATNRLRVTLSGGIVNRVLADKSGLTSEEIFMVDRGSLGQGNYLLTAQLLTAGGTVLHEIIEKIAKPFEGLPVCALDENNSVRVHGELFFPITPWGLNDAQVSSWASAGYITSVMAKGYWPTDDSPPMWGGYLDIAEGAGVRAVGPGRWNNSTGSWTNYSVADVKSYIAVSKDHPAMNTYQWGDEPDLHNVNGAPLRSQSFITHYEDPQHITSCNFAGATWEADEGFRKGQRIANYNFLTNGVLFGKRTLLNDIYTLDYYPVEWAAPSNRDASFDILIKIMSRLKNENYNLAPIGGFVETCDINETDWGSDVYPTPWHPTPEQLKMTIWINMVAGARTFSWFHHHTVTPPDNRRVMADFVEDIGQLKEVVLGPETSPGVTVTAPEGVRIEHMERIHNDTLYIFTVRVSESDMTGASLGSTENATINLPAGWSAVSGSVFDESRSISIGGNSFTDSYGVNDVHIYKIFPNGAVNAPPHRAINEPMFAMPNPTYREIKIDGHGLGTAFSVYNARGRLIGHSRNGRVNRLDGDTFTTGMYLVKFENSALVQKVILVK